MFSDLLTVMGFFSGVIPVTFLWVAFVLSLTLLTFRFIKLMTETSGFNNTRNHTSLVFDDIDRATSSISNNEDERLI